MKIEFKSLEEVEKSHIIDLMNNALVRRQMPLLKGDFNETDCDRFVSAKAQMWKTHGFGPWAFVIDNKFAGWGGIQPDNGEADLALVLHPDYWGIGKVLYKRIIDKAFGELGISSIQVLFPPTRTRIKGLLRLGFVKDKDVKSGDEHFIRYVLNKKD
ncbi:GNAT family N-acetyltransferase [Winogradskyella sp.]|uniref:GNAT family N-acetyltransferase n=1 Tax=Winogradskyella sp. TaxID=1883156 RepID=UPI003BA8B4DD